MARHRRNFKQFLRGDKVSHIRSYDLFNEYGVENCKIELIEYYKCDTLQELRRKEGEHIKNTECVNKNVTGRTPKEYRELNKDRMKEYYELNKHKYKEYHTQNKDKILEKQKEYRKNKKNKIYEKEKQYRQTHKEQRAEYIRNYREKNKDKINEQKREYYRKKKEIQ